MPTETIKPPKSRSYTNWDAFTKAGLVPVSIKCEGYAPFFTSDPSCHSYVKLDAVNLKQHYESEHGGGFRLFLKKSDGKSHPLWNELSLAQLEAGDFRCEVCNEKLRFHPTSILPHAKQHRGMTRQAYATLSRDNKEAVAFLNIALRDTPVEVDDSDESVE